MRATARGVQSRGGVSVNGALSGTGALSEAGARVALGDAARERVSEIQRARILGAMTHVAAEQGAASVTVGKVVERAGVSRRTFYELFVDSEDCLLAAIDEALAAARRRVLETYDPKASWQMRVRSGLIALLAFFDEQSAMARLLVVESLAAGPRALERRRQALAPVLALVEEGRRQPARGTGPPPLAAEGAVGGVLSVMHERICSGWGERGLEEPLSALTGQLASMVVLPYMGPAAARRELDKPAPVVSANPVPSVPDADPFKDAGMRITYRTMRVLGAIASSPGASNRLIGGLADIEDQGQISKLLARLERMGVIANDGGHAKGDPNAWTLTPSGHQLQQSLDDHCHEQPAEGRAR